MSKNWKVLYIEDQKRMRRRKWWRKYGRPIKVLSVIVAAYLSMILIAVLRFQGPYNSIRQVAMASNLQTGFGELSFLGNVRTMIKKPGFAWKCLWMSEDDLHTAIFLSFDIDASRRETQSKQSSQDAIPSIETDIHQPTSVDTENHIEHVRTDDGYFSSTICYSFETDFLVEEGANAGDICSLRLSVVYRDKAGDVRVTDENIVPNIVAGNRVYMETVILDPDGYIAVDDIVGYNIR